MRHDCASLGFHACSWTVFDQTLPALRHLQLLLHWERRHTRPGRPLRPGTPAVVRRSAGLDCVALSPLGSVVMPGSASFNPP